MGERSPYSVIIHPRSRVVLAADAYLPKPIDFDTLLPLVEQYCEQSRQCGS